MAAKKIAIPPPEYRTLKKSPMHLTLVTRPLKKSKSPMHLALVTRRPDLIAHLSHDTVTYSDKLFAKELIPEGVWRDAKTPGIPKEEKAETMFDAALCKAEHDDSALENLIDVFNSDGYTKSTVKKLYATAAALDASENSDVSGICSDFEHLNVKSLTEHEKSLFLRRLQDDTRGMEGCFYDFTISVRESLKIRHALEEVKGRILIASSINLKVKDKIKQAKSLDKIFNILMASNQVTFISYHLIEDLVGKFGSDDDHKNLASYLAKFREYGKRNIFEVPKSVFDYKAPKSAKSLVLKVLKETLSLNGAKEILHKWAHDIVGIQLTDFTVCNVEEGCVELHLLVSAAVAERVFPVTPSQHSALSEIGVRVIDPQETQITEEVKDIKAIENNTALEGSHCYMYEEMATEFEKSTAEYRTIERHYRELVFLINYENGYFCDAFWVKDLIPEDVWDYARAPGIPDEVKARRMLDAVLGKAKHDATVFKCLIDVLNSNEYTKSTARKMLATVAELQVPNTSLKSGDSDNTGNEKGPQFPYLDMEGLTEHEQSILKRKLQEEAEKMERCFNDFTVSVEEMLKSYDFEEVTSQILENCSIEMKHKEMINQKKSIEEVFIVLRTYNYISFFNYHLLEDLVKKFGSDDDHKKLDVYKEELKEYSKRNVFEVPKSAFDFETPEDAKMLVLKCVEHVLTLNDAQGLLYKLVHDVFNNVKLRDFRLCDIKRGCVELYILVSAAVAKRVFPVTPSQHSDLSEIGVRVLDPHQEAHITEKPQKINTATEIGTALEEVEADYGLRRKKQVLIENKPDRDRKKRAVLQPWNKIFRLTINGKSFEDDAQFFESETDQLRREQKILRRKQELQLSREREIFMIKSWWLRRTQRYLSTKNKTNWLRGEHREQENKPNKFRKGLEDLLYETHTLSVARTCRYTKKFSPTIPTFQTQSKHLTNGFAIVILEDTVTLTTVGGKRYGVYSNKLYSMRENKWQEDLPPMPTKRQTPGAVYTKNKLVVAGGDNGRFLSTVEMLNIAKRKWSSVGSLPFKTNQPSMCTIGDTLYLHPGHTQRESDQFSVLKCSLANLEQSNPSSRVWKRIAPLPVRRSSLIAVGGQLLAVGGLETEPTRNVYQYNDNTDSWTVVGRLLIARYACQTALLPDNKLIAFGGIGAQGSIEHAEITNY